jgi:hypothetical protein
LENSRRMVDQRSMVSQHPMTKIYYGTPGFGAFQSTSSHISRSAKLANSQSGVDQRSTVSQHPTTDIYDRNIGFGTSKLWGSRTLEDFTSAHPITPELMPPYFDATKLRGFLPPIPSRTISSRVSSLRTLGSDATRLL